VGPKASSEGKVRNYPKSQDLYRGAELGIFLSPKASLERERSEFFQVQELISEGGRRLSSEFFQVEVIVPNHQEK